MAKKTNKTSHVMDLLTNGASSETEDTVATAESAAADTSEKKGDVQSHTVSPSKVTVVDEGSINDRVSQEILNKLSEELKEDLAQDTPAAEESPAMQDNAPVPAQEESLIPETAAEPEVPAIDETEIKEEAAAEPKPQEMETAAEEVQPEASQDVEPVQGKPVPIVPKSQLSSTLQTGDYHFVNVMEQLLLRQDIDDFLKQYNVCPCQRCVTDVCALTLTGLPSKYVVVNKDSVSPLLSYYESRYKIYMLTEMIKACNKVRESPRHKR